MNLTDLSIRALRPPSKGAVIYYDERLAGFGVRVSEGGTKSFILTHGPRRTRETLGRVELVSLQEARRAAKLILAEYALGKHRPRSVTWKNASEEYLTEVKAGRRPSTYKSYSRHLGTHFRFGDMKMTELAPHDFQRILDRLKDRPAELHHAFVILRAFIRWAHRKHYLDRSPIERMKTPPASKPRERILTIEELNKVWNACPDDPFGRIVRLLIITGQRVGETSKLTAKMIGKDTITIPASITKNGRSHTIPLPNLARPFLHNLAFNGFAKSKARLDKASGVSDYTLHDLRRTYASGLASLGVQLPVIEKLLNHVSGSFSGVVGVYQRYDFMPEMRAASEKWTEYLQSIVGANCVDFRRN